ncbi:hypothetical protein [Ferroacidibacillus organovorans]|uniref:Septation ring formation regulator EzrA n=1 Tax=Ferroacidibacillus organovorans TaxID=1765683 RepID=A0A101XQM5_9BACL|nr:hypothetical protein [Ferroacidibacillus organovorans]KUO95737.1 hypothetical protein ATW55_05230 [Ferroacidibacillus organovorans]
MIKLIGFAIVIAGVIYLISLRRRKGDFSFRIKKIKHRVSDLLSLTIKLRTEAEFAALERPDEIKQVMQWLDECSGPLVEIKEALDRLEQRAKSWTDASDLYVDIGMQEEALERIQPLLMKAKETLGA